GHGVLGHRAGADLGGGDGPGHARRTAHLRLRGWRAAIAESPEAADGEELIATTDGYTRGDGAQAMARLLDSGAAPDAVFCYNDLIAIGAMRTLTERGLRVPEDVAVVGFDDIDDGRYCSTSLTTIAPHKQAIAQAAVDTLLARLEGGEEAAQTEPRHIRPGFALIRRESTVGRP
ncbi:LacI family DNA-binding transcriptional regulator, partial [Streptomonospora algeriensis]